MLQRDRLIAACSNQLVDRPPVWLMRQAGRYLPEYQEIRQRYTFWEMMRAPEIVMEVSLQPIHRFGMDAAILFSDILIVLDAMGFEVEYGAKGPVVTSLVDSIGDLHRLTGKPTEIACSYVEESIKLLCRTLHPEVAVIGFAGGPFTLAAYATEPGPQRSVEKIIRLAKDRPDVYEELLSRIVEVVAQLLELQIVAGADVVQIFDTWAGRLDGEAYQKIALPYTKKVIARLQHLKTPIVLYVRNAKEHLENAASTGCTVLAVDESLSLAEARRRLGPKIGLQGNFNPDCLLDTPDQIQKQVHQMINDANGDSGYIVNLGRGLSPTSPIEGVEAMIGAVKEWRK